jgi:hypothetical protein
LKSIAAKAVGRMLLIPEIPPKKSAFGWVKVKGSIDGFEISKCFGQGLLTNNHC